MKGFYVKAMQDLINLISMMICRTFSKLKAMKKYLSAALIVAMTAAACTKETPIVNEENYCFVADFNEDSPVKTVLRPNAGEKKAYVEWLADDQVAVFDGSAKYCYKAAASGASTNLVPVETSVGDADAFYAIYPYSESASFADGTLTAELPADQTGVKGSFATHLAVARTTGSNMNFKNLCGLIKVNIAVDNVTSIEFKGNSDEVVAGPVNITFEDGAPTYVPAEGSDVKTIVMKPESGKVFEPGDYYFAVLPQKFEAGFTVTSYKNDGRKVVRAAVKEGGIVINRSAIATGKAFGITGQGTEGDPYVIMTVQDMVDMKDLTDMASPTYFKLGDNIDMKDVKTWEAVNSSASPDAIAEIHFDGNNKTISNFAPEAFTGLPSLLGVVYGSCKNLTMTDVSISCPDISHVAPLASYVGFYDGTVKLSGSVDNVHASGSVSGLKVVGGLIGAAVNATITNSSANVNAELLKDDNFFVAGFAAQANGAVTFTNCSASGKVINPNRRAAAFCAGASESNCITGEEGKIVIENCYATGDVDARYPVAGIFAQTETVTHLHIKNCYATGNFTCERQTGGVLGLINTSSAKVTVENCYYTGTIKGTLKSSKSDEMNVGGVVGYIAKGTDIVIRNSFAISDLVGTTKKGYVGGVLGCAKAKTTIENCYADCSISTANFPGGIVGYITDKTEVSISNSTFAGTGTENVCGGGATPTVKDCSIVSEDLTASQIAAKLGWGENEAWDLTGDAPVLKK